MSSRESGLMPYKEWEKATFNKSKKGEFRYNAVDSEKHLTSLIPSREKKREMYHNYQMSEGLHIQKIKVQQQGQIPIHEVDRNLKFYKDYVPQSYVPKRKFE